MEKDILKSAALAYRKLLNIEYRIVLGRKGKRQVLDIAFLPDNFYHLAGLHKLKKKYWFQNRTSSWVLENILSGKISESDILSDKNIGKLCGRLHALENLELFMDASQTKFFAYDCKKVLFDTKLSADYLAKGNLENGSVTFSFFVNDSGKYYINSIFPAERYDYSMRQMQYTVLLKEKMVYKKELCVKTELMRHKNFSNE